MFSCDDWDQRNGSSINSNNLRRTKRSAAGKTVNLWTDRRVYYAYDPYGLFSEKDKAVIRSAVDEWQAATCLKFEEVDENNSSVNKIIFFDGCDFGVDYCGCWSYVGMLGFQQYLSLSHGCRDRRTVLHEIGHVIGIWHEHNHPDRDHYVSINEDNVDENVLDNFKKLSWREVLQMGLPYDYLSVMHYGKYAFAKTTDGEPTVRTVEPLYQDVIGTSEHLSVIDVNTVNMMYDCKMCTGV